LLEELPGYFEEIITFEREKKEHGTFMAKTSAENVIKQIEGFIENPDANLLIKVFDEEVDSFEGLTGEERADFKARNKEVVLETVVPAYRSLADSLAELNADNARAGGFSSIESGGEYYEYLAMTSSGSRRSIDEFESMIDSAVDQSWGTINALYDANPSILDAMENPAYPVSGPNEILDYLRNVISENFPAATDDGYELKYVDESLEKFISSGLYLTPPIDDTTHNVIYLNNSYAQEVRGGIFSLMAHEGYPGHLYQIVYFRNLDRAPVRKAIATDGYVEGWAIYVEQMSYRLAKLDENVATALAAETIGSLCISAKIDLAVNVRGWSVEDVGAYLSQFVVVTDETVKEIYDTVVAEPTIYAKYAIGYLEIVELKNQAQELWGADFSEMKFHEFLLETGPAPFAAIAERLPLWSAGAADEEKAAA
jgi:uncharacterized protein (DUF885 family)